MNAINYLKHFRSIRWAIRLNRNSNGRSLVKVFKYSNGTRSGTMLASFITTFPFVVNAWNSKDTKLEEKKILDRADQLFAEDKFDELVQLLKQTPSWYDNCETLWRVARCQYHISKNMKNKNEASQLLNESYELVKRAIELDEECGAAHKWAAILLDAVSELKGTRERIEQILNVRDHMEKAVKYSPTDPTSYHLLGHWHYSCYNVSWIERKIAGIIYGSLPDANLEVALEHLEKAEQIEQDFYSKNKVLIAQILVSLNRDLERAKSLLVDVLQKYKDSPKWDDIEAVKDAKEVLKKLGVKTEGL